MTLLRSGPGRVEHRCEPPVESLDIPSLPLGSAWQCDECRRVWLVDKPPTVDRGQQRVPPLWRKATWWEARRAKRATTTTDTGE